MIIKLFVDQTISSLNNFMLLLAFCLFFQTLLCAFKSLFRRVLHLIICILIHTLWVSLIQQTQKNVKQFQLKFTTLSYTQSIPSTAFNCTYNFQLFKSVSWFSCLLEMQIAKKLQKDGTFHHIQIKFRIHSIRNILCVK